MGGGAEGEVERESQADSLIEGEQSQTWAQSHDPEVITSAEIKLDS